MNDRDRIAVLKIVAGIWILTVPLLLIGALISNMDTVERYYVQLAVVVTVSLVAAISIVGAFLERTWARLGFLLLSWASAAFWISSAHSLYEVSHTSEATEGIHLIPAAFGVLNVALAVLLHTAGRGKQEENGT
jgi:hypothetical protein